MDLARTSPDAASPVELLDPSGRAVTLGIERASESSIEAWLVPSSPLALGPYQLKLTSSSVNPTPDVVTTSFVVVEAAALPTAATPPTVTLGQPYRQTVSIPGGPACVDQVDSAVIDVTVIVPEPYRPFRSLTVLEATTEGDLRWALGGKAADTAGLDDSLSVTHRITRPCEAGPGAGRVTFAARIRGVDAPSIQASQEVQLPRCETLGIVSTPGGADTGGSAMSPTDAGDSGCSTSRHTSGSGYAAGLIVMATLVGRLRRRRATKMRPLRGDAPRGVRP